MEPVLEDPRYPIGRHQPPAEITPAVRQACIDRIAALPQALRAAVGGLTEAQLATPYREGGWTVRQVVHHLPDSHLNAYVRFKLALTEEAPRIRPYQEARWAELPDSRDTPVDTSLALLGALHERWVRLLRALDDDAWARTFEHPESGVHRLDGAVGLYAWHGDHHLAQITGLRGRMGW